jgi:hypothetical protein
MGVQVDATPKIAGYDLVEAVQAAVTRPWRWRCFVVVVVHYRCY